MGVRPADSVSPDLRWATWAPWKNSFTADIGLEAFLLLLGRKPGPGTCLAGRGPFSRAMGGLWPGGRAVAGRGGLWLGGRPVAGRGGLHRVTGSCFSSQ